MTFFTTPHLPPARPSRLTGWLQNWVEAGVDFDLSPSERRKQCIVNSGPLILATVLFFYLILFALTGSEKLILTLMVQVPMAAFGVLWFRLRQRQNRPPGYRFLALLLTTDVWVAILYGQGTLIGTHFYFLLFALVTPLTVPLARWPDTVLISGLHVGQFLFLEIASWPAAPEIAHLPVVHLAALKSVVFLCMAVSVIAVIYISEMYSALLEARLDSQANTDVLTNLPNRRAFLTFLKHNLAKAERENSPLCLAIVDIDYFKRINDTHGHNCGDEALQHVARQLREHARLSDFVARFGGEEFIVLMVDTAEAAARGAAERLRRAVAEWPCCLDGLTLPITASLGVAEWRAGMRLAQLIEAADRALYTAKETGRNRVCLGAGSSPV